MIKPGPHTPHKALRPQRFGAHTNAHLGLVYVALCYLCKWEKWPVCACSSPPSFRPKADDWHIGAVRLSMFYVKNRERAVTCRSRGFPEVIWKFYKKWRETKRVESEFKGSNYKEIKGKKWKEAEYFLFTVAFSHKSTWLTEIWQTCFISLWDICLLNIYIDASFESVALLDFLMMLRTRCDQPNHL